MTIPPTGLNQIDCSLIAMAREFHHEMANCLVNNPFGQAMNDNASCIAIAAMQAYKNMTARCEARPGSLKCTPKDYIVGVIEDIDAQNRTLKWGFGRLKNKVSSAVELPPSKTAMLVAVGGCAVGGIVGGGVGMRLTPFVPIVGGSFGLVVGCQRGAIVAEGGYGLWKVVVKASESYEVIEKAFDSIGKRNAACGPTAVATPAGSSELAGPPPLNHRLFFTKDAAKSLSDMPESRFSRPTPSSLALNTPPSASQSTLTPLPSQRPFTVTPMTPSSSQAPCSSTDPIPSTYDVGMFTWIEVEDAAQKLIDIAADFIGATGAVTQTKELKQMFVTILSNPENAPKILFDQLIKEPEKMFAKIISTPEEFIVNGKAFINDPTLMGALNTVGTIYTVISLANELLPMLEKVTVTALKNPLKAPVVMTEEMSKLMISKIVGVVKLAECLLKNPLKTVEHLYKSFVKAPEKLYKNIIHFGGHKKRKRRKRQAREEARLRAEAERLMHIEAEKVKQEIITVFPRCYTTAKQMWRIPEAKTPEAYFSDLVKDWKNATAQTQFQGNCALFIREVHELLLAGKFSAAYQLSPTAHSAETKVPVAVAYAIIGLARTTLFMGCEIISLERDIKEFEQAALQYKGRVDSITAFTQDLQSLRNGKTDQHYAEEIRQGLASEDKKARARALFR